MGATTKGLVLAICCFCLQTSSTWYPSKTGGGGFVVVPARILRFPRNCLSLSRTTKPMNIKKKQHDIIHRKWAIFFMYDLCLNCFPIYLLQLAKINTQSAQNLRQGRSAKKSALRRSCVQLHVACVAVRIASFFLSCQCGPALQQPEMFLIAWKQHNHDSQSRRKIKRGKIQSERERENVKEKRKCERKKKNRERERERERERAQI